MLRAILIEPPPLQIDTPRLLTIVHGRRCQRGPQNASIGKLAKYYKGAWATRAVGGPATHFAQQPSTSLKVGRPCRCLPSSDNPGAIHAVIYESIRAARARGCDLLFVDTAGRLHTKFNLMKELEKVYSFARRACTRRPRGFIGTGRADGQTHSSRQLNSRNQFILPVSF